MWRGKTEEFSLYSCHETKKSHVFKSYHSADNNECNKLTIIIINNVTFIILCFSLDPYILSRGAYIFLLIWLKTVLKFGIIIRT